MIEVTLWHWLAFGGFVVAMLALDLGVFHRHSRETTLREAAIWTAIWCSLAISFNVLIFFMAGRAKAAEFLTGYLIEWSLSMDNVFVFAVIFAYFRVPLKYQYRVLFWGIMGAIVMRLAFILVGAALIERFHWVVWVLGAFLVYTGIKLATHDDNVDPEKSWVLRIARRWLPVSKDHHGEQFFAREDGRLCITPLFLVLLVVESTDVAFAIDSVPAIFSITRDKFIVFTSNIFAILGLRALYFLLAGVMDLFRYLRFGLAAILVFVGVKMLIHDGLHIGSVQIEGIHISPGVSLGVVATLLTVSIVASIIASRRELRALAKQADEPVVPSIDTPSEEEWDESAGGPHESRGQ